MGTIALKGIGYFFIFLIIRTLFSDLEVWLGPSIYVTYFEPNNLTMKKIIVILILVCFFSQCRKELLPEFSEFTNPRDGYTYQTVKIGSQIWFAENLRYLPVVNHPDDMSSADKRYYVAGYYGTDLTEAMSAMEYEICGAQDKPQMCVQVLQKLPCSCCVSGLYHNPHFCSLNCTEWF